MESPFKFPTSQPQEDMSGAYSRWMGNIPDNSITSHLNPEDERIKILRNLYAKPSGAEGVVSDYINSMPQREDYKPSIWRKLGGVLLGTLNRTGYQGAKNFVEEPYQNAYSEWNKEGQFIDDRARILEADKNREIKATEFGLKTANETARRNAGLSSTRTGQVINAAGQDVRNQNADASLDYRKFQDEIRNNQRDEALNNTRNSQNIINQINQMRLDYMRDHGGQTPPSTPAPAKPVDPIDLEAKRTKDIETIKEGINAKAMSDPQFSKYFNPDGSIKNSLDSRTKADLIAYLNGELQKKLVILGGK